MRLTLTATTPPASAGARKMFERLVEPQHREPIADRRPLTVGEVLDEEPGDCRARWWAFKAATGRLTIISKRCGKRSCPRCVVSWLVERVAPAWSYWCGEADVLDNTDGLSLRGGNAEPGIIVATLNDGRRWAIAPGTGWRGRDLDDTLVRLIRELPLEERPAGEKGTPVDWFGKLPDGTTTEKIRWAAEVADIDIRHLPGDMWEAFTTSEQRKAFADALWSFRLIEPKPLVDGSYEPTTPVHKGESTPPQLPSTYEELVPVPTASTETTPVHKPVAPEEQKHIRPREVRTGVPEPEVTDLKPGRGLFAATEGEGE